MFKCFCRMPLAVLFTLPAAADVIEKDVNFGVHDFVVSDISPSSIYNKDNSHALGIDLGATIKYIPAPNIVIGGDAEIYLDHDVDHLDPDRTPLWYRLQFYAIGDAFQLTEDTNIKWHLDYRYKLNTASGVEREVKEFIGMGLHYNNDVVHLAFSGYTGFFYLEIDDDTPRQYAGYDRENLDNGTSAVSIKLDGSVKFSENILFSSSIQNWTSIGVGSSWLENEFVAEISYNSNDWIQGSRLHFRVIATQYKLDGYYRKDLDAPVLPWDNDTLLRAYISVPW